MLDTVISLLEKHIHTSEPWEALKIREGGASKEHMFDKLENLTCFAFAQQAS